MGKNGVYSLLYLKRISRTLVSFEEKGGGWVENQCVCTHDHVYYTFYTVHKHHVERNLWVNPRMNRVYKRGLCV